MGGDGQQWERQVEPTVPVHYKARSQRVYLYMGQASGLRLRR